MKWYCEKCKSLHSDDEMCPYIQNQLHKDPKLLSEAADFTSIAGQYALISSNSLDVVAKAVNKIAGTNLSYEGTHQFARDIQVFKRLSEEPFKRSGAFSSPENAKRYLESVTQISKTTPRAMTSFESKLTGYAQEVDWIRFKDSQLSSLWQKSKLLSNNAAGIDGVTVNRFTGKTVSRTTIKASKNLITKNSTAINDVKEAIAKGTATSKDTIFGTQGIKNAAKQAGLKNPVIEKNSMSKVNASNERLKSKIASGQATTQITPTQLGQKTAQGAVIGAAVKLSISSITEYVRFKNGEISQKEAFSNISQSAVSGTITGGTMSAVTLFLPAGPIGFVAGIAIGIYVDTACTNILDEIWGKGAYGEILNSSGYVYGTTINLKDYLDRIGKNMALTQNHISYAQAKQSEIRENFKLFEQLKEES